MYCDCFLDCSEYHLEITPTYFQDAHLGKLGLSFCIRGIMTTNDNPVPGWNPVRKPPSDEKM